MFKDSFGGLTNIEGPAYFGPVEVSSILWVILGIAFFVYLIVTLILVYHWRTYGMKSRRIFYAQILYFIGSVIIFGIAITSIMLIS